MATAYDEVRYPGKFYPQSSPDRIGAIGTLYGVDAAPADRCRMLELGCGDGGNLIPLAERFPRSRFLGIDLAPETIADGQAVIAELGLSNIELRCADIAAFAVEPRAWDYIISHGVLSWAPEEARQRMLQIFGEGLADHGLAYVSYSCLPGGYLRNYPRDLMRFHTRNIPALADRAKAAREVVAFVDAAAPAGSIVHDILRREMAGTEGRDFFLLHDLLADENEPFYFLDVIETAKRSGLQYVAESDLSAMQTFHLAEARREQVDAIASRLEREQYLDFINLRRFRQTILARQRGPGELEIAPERLEQLLIRGRFTAVPGAAKRFRSDGGELFTPEDELSDALVDVLAEAGATLVRLADLQAAAAARLGGAAADGLLPRLVEFFVRDRIALHTCPLDYGAAVPAFPCVSANTRRLAAAGEPFATRELTAFYPPSQLVRTLVELCDGTRSHARLLIDLAGRVGAADRAALDEATLTRALELLARNALFEG